MTQIKSLALLVMSVVIAYFLAIPAASILFKYVESSGALGAEAFLERLAGMFLVLLFLVAFVYGVFFTKWGTNAITISLALLSIFALSFLSAQGGWVFLVSGIVGYILGLAVRKLVERFRQPTA